MRQWTEASLLQIVACLFCAKLLFETMLAYHWLHRKVHQHNVSHFLSALKCKCTCFLEYIFYIAAHLRWYMAADYILNVVYCTHRLIENRHGTFLSRIDGSLTAIMFSLYTSITACSALDICMNIVWSRTFCWFDEWVQLGLIRDKDIRMHVISHVLEIRLLPTRSLEVDYITATNKLLVFIE